MGEQKIWIAIEGSIFFREGHIVKHGIFHFSEFPLSLQSVNNILENSQTLGCQWALKKSCQREKYCLTQKNRKASSSRREENTLII